MARIKVLPEDLAHKIAAGEVVERPASVVKELVENSIDAKATRITIEVKEGGRELLKVTDTGHGIHKEDLPLAFLRHATSKISSVEDLFSIHTLGFRGEALPSIASVSNLTLKTKQKEEEEGYKVEVHGTGEALITPYALHEGTIVEVRDLFFNTPARYKFLKSPMTEKRYITDYVIRSSLAHPKIAFTLLMEEQVVLKTHGRDMLDTISALFGVKLARDLLPVHCEATWGSLHGYVAPPSYAKGTRQGQTLLLNGRVIRAPSLSHAMEKAYAGLLGQRQYPFGILSFTMDPTTIDVNVHPAKTEVRFLEESTMYRDVVAAVKRSLLEKDLSASLAEAKQPERVVQIPWMDPFEPSSVVNKEGQGELFLPPLATNKPLEEKKRSSSEVRDQLLNARILGQLHQTFILLETKHGLWILDQHIVHERILYERFLQPSEVPPIQQLLPVPLDFSPSEYYQVAEQQKPLEDLGFVLEPFGPTSFLLRGIPTNIQKSAKGYAFDLLEVCHALSAEANPKEKVALVLSCKGSVKAGDYLSTYQITKLLSQLAETENPYTCPHGRPIIVTFETTELLRRFGR